MSYSFFNNPTKVPDKGDTATPEILGLLGEWATRSLSLNSSTVSVNSLLATPEIATLIQSYQASKPKVYQNNLDLNHFDHLMKDFRLAKAMDKVIFKSIKKAFRQEKRVFERKRREKIIRRFLARRANLREFLRIAELSYIDYIAKLNKIAERIIQFINVYQEEAIKKMEELLKQIRLLEAQLAYIQQLQEQTVKHYSKKVTKDLLNSKEIELKAKTPEEKASAEQRVENKIGTLMKTEAEIRFIRDLKNEQLAKSEEKAQEIDAMQKKIDKYMEETFGKTLDANQQDESDDIEALFSEIEESKHSIEDDEKSLEDLEDNEDVLQDMLERQKEEEDILTETLTAEIKSLPTPSIGLMQGISDRQKELLSMSTKVTDLKSQNEELTEKIANRKKEIKELKSRLQLKLSQLDSKKNELRELRDARKKGRIDAFTYGKKMLESKERIRRTDARCHDMQKQLLAMQTEYKQFKDEASSLNEKLRILNKDVIEQTNSIHDEFQASASTLASAGSPAAAAGIVQQVIDNKLANLEAGIARLHELKHQEHKVKAELVAVKADAGAYLWNQNEESSAIRDDIATQNNAELKFLNDKYGDVKEAKSIFSSIEESMTTGTLVTHLKKMRDELATASASASASLASKVSGPS